MCNLVCEAMGRHVHIEDCHVENVTTCSGNDEFQHINPRLLPATSSVLKSSPVQFFCPNFWTGCQVSQN